MAERAGTPPRGMREPPPLATVQRRARAANASGPPDEDNPLQPKFAKPASVVAVELTMTPDQVKTMLITQGFDLDNAYLDAIIQAFDTDENGLIDRCNISTFFSPIFG